MTVHDSYTLEFENRGNLPQPLDRKMLGGVVLNSLVEPQLEDVADRLQMSFDAIRSDETREHGDCIALALPVLELEQEDIIDSLMLEVAKRQNHGMQTFKLDESISLGAVDKVWAGLDPHTGKLLRLIKRTGPVCMTDGSVPVGTLWALKARDARFMMTE